MNKTRTVASAIAICLAGASMTACVQFPTEKAAVADMRPQVSFVIPEGAPNLREAKVYVNGLDVGKAGDFMEGKAAVRILPGSNVIKVVDGPRTVIEEKIYLGDGVARSFILK